MAKPKRGIAASIYQLKIQLVGIMRPPVWRLVQMPSSDSLFDLHNVIIGAFEWSDTHKHIVASETQQYRPLLEGETNPDVDERACNLKKLLKNQLDAFFIYQYDIDGDVWEHSITLENITVENPKFKYPFLVKGSGTRPPENCGGLARFQQLKVAYLDSNNENYQAAHTLLGEAFDPAVFNRDAQASLIMEKYLAGKPPKPEPQDM